MATDLTTIEQAFIDAALNITGIAGGYIIEPTRLDVLPAVTLLFIGCPNFPSTTGYSVVNWMWRCSLTLPANGLDEAQTLFKTLIPSLLAITRADPSLNGTCDWATLDDRGEEPFTIEGNTGFRKNLYLTAQTTESVG